jgi:hypothetical protein
MHINGACYVKALHQTSAPVHIIAAAAEVHPIKQTRRSDVSAEGATHVWSVYARRQGTRFLGSRIPIRRTIDEWWSYLATMHANGQRLYLVVPLGTDFCTLARFWDRIQRGDYWVSHPGGGRVLSRDGKLRSVKPWHRTPVLRGRVNIVQARSKCGSLTILSVKNWGDLTWEEMSRVAGLHGVPTATDTLGPHPQPPDPYDQCTVIMGYVQSLMSRWVADRNGPWRHTAAQLAVTLWRTRFYEERICRHAEPQAVELESAALHGGRASVWCHADLGWRLSLGGGAETPPPPSVYGSIPGTLYRLDIRSMYPSLLHTEQFPVALHSVRPGCPAADLTAALRHGGVVARVELETDVAEYPVRTSRRTYYPVGRFVTTLAGPELTEALARNHVRCCHGYNRYELGTPFRGLARYLIGERAKCRTAGDIAGETYFKTLANAFGGKLAQRADTWKPRPELSPPIPWGEWWLKEKDTEPAKLMMSIARLAHERVEGQPGAKLLAAAFGYLTSLGRVMMWKLRDAIGSDHIVAQDTDGIWVLEGGYRLALRRGLLGSDSAGTLRVVSTHTFARFVTPRHYYVDGVWTLAGYDDRHQILPNGRIVEERTLNPANSRCRGTPRRLLRLRREKPLVSMNSTDRIGKDGWAVAQYITAASDLTRIEDAANRRSRGRKGRA